MAPFLRDAGARSSPRRMVFLASLGLLVLAATTFVAIAPLWAEPPDETPIDRLIRQLGSDQFAQREAAERELLKLGKAALPALRQAAQESRDEEVRFRARRLFGQIQAQLAGGKGKAAPPGPWSQLVSADTLRREIEACVKAVEPALANQAQFNVGHRTVRGRYSVAAACFAVLAQYSGEAPFKTVAPGMRDLIARSARNCKVNSAQALTEAQHRRALLRQVLAGGKPVVPQAKPKVPFADVTDITPLMKRFNMVLAKHFAPVVQGKTPDAAGKAKLRHEAEIVAMLAKVIQEPSFADGGGDAAFHGYAREVEHQAVEIARKAKAGDWKAVRTAVSRMSKSCSSCHGEYR